jgi:hypothetical protein
MKTRLLFQHGLGSLALMSSTAWTASNVSFSQSVETVEAYDYVEVTLNVDKPDAGNPFLNVAVTGSFSKTDGSERKTVEGFCDSGDGTVFRIRFMPASPGDYTWSATYRQGAAETTHTGAFKASAGQRKGPIRVDPKYPWYFIWEGTSEHYFFNGTTAFWLMGWRDERISNKSIDRLRQLKINRLRVLLSGAANILWGEPVMTGENFTMMLQPWMAEAPNSFDNPKIDFTRFNIPFWQKWERMLRYARDRDVIISAILEISTHKAQPDARSEDERRYVRYAVARLSAFSNITWDLGDDLDTFRDEKWTHETGTLLVGWDPYKHLATSHPTHREPQDRGSARSREKKFAIQAVTRRTKGHVVPLATRDGRAVGPACFDHLHEPGDLVDVDVIIPFGIGGAATPFHSPVKSREHDRLPETRRGIRSEVRRGPDSVQRVGVSLR